MGPPFQEILNVVGLLSRKVVVITRALQADLTSRGRALPGTVAPFKSNQSAPHQAFQYISRRGDSRDSWCRSKNSLVSHTQTTLVRNAILPPLICKYRTLIFLSVVFTRCQIYFTSLICCSLQFLRLSLSFSASKNKVPQKVSLPPSLAKETLE